MNPLAALRVLAALLLSLQLGAPATLAQGAPGADVGTEESPPLDEAPAARGARHRLDSSFSFLDTPGLDSVNLTLGYTFNLTPNANLSLVLPLVDGDVEDFGPYGVGDLTLAVSYAPFVELSANPWVPKTVGSGLALVLPTGDASQNRGLGAVVANPFVGGALPLSDAFFVFPRIAYFHSLDPTFAGLDVRQGTLSVGLTWVSSSSFWVAPLVELARDFEENEWAFNYEVIVGKMFSSGLGLAVSYFDYELLDPANGAGLGKTGDRYLGVSLFYAF